MLNYLQLVNQPLAQFAAQDDFVSKMELVFGHGIDRVKLASLRQSLLAGEPSNLLSIEVLSQQELGTAQGVYAAAGNQIYLSAEFLATASESAIAGVILEEFGHAIDALLNRQDTVGDEGALFSAVVRGAKLTAVEIDQMKAENDFAYITIDGQRILVEQANLVGTYANNVITGTVDGDVIRGLQGNDDLSGLAGNDTLYGDLGSDTLRGGVGNDRFVMQYYNDYSTTRNLDVVADFTKGQDKIDLNEIGISDFNTILAITGNDATGSAVITAHYKILFAATSTNGYGLKINGLSKAQLQATDFLLSNVVTNDLAQGTADGDDLFGSLGNDTLYGNAGEDRLFGEQGNDLLFAGFGNDTLYGGAGNDLFSLQYFNDYSTTKNLDVIVDFAKGQDKIDLREIGISDFNTMLAISNNDFTGSAVITAYYNALSAASSSYAMRINGISKAQLQATDFLFSTAMINESALGTVNNDDLFGGWGSDTLKGSSGTDRLFGEQGNDLLAGDFGSDTLSGGAGSDLFVLQYFNGYSTTRDLDIVVDFAKGQDKIDLRDAGISDFNTILAITNNDATGSVAIAIHYNALSAASSSYITRINGIGKAQLQATDFLFSTAAGNDSVQGTANGDDLFGGLGNDTLRGDAGGDRLFGEQGNDFLAGGFGSDTLSGGAGNDLFVIQYFNDLSTMKNLDIITDFTKGQDRIDLRTIGISDFNTILTITNNDASGSSVISAYYSGLSAALSGYSMKINGIGKSQLQSTDFLFDTAVVNNSYLGTNNNDDLFGGLGNDSLTGYAGDDRLFGEQGNDALAGGYGNDTLYGGAGNDAFAIEYFDSSALLIFFTIKNVDTITDFVKGQDKIDVRDIRISDFNTLMAITTEDASGNSVITAHYRSIAGNIYDDGYATKINGIRKNQLQVSDCLLSTAIVNDNESGTEDDDDLFGGYGNDTLSGLAGEDKLFGEYGNDILSGGAGADILYGGAGVDAFLLNKIGVDTIRDFAIGEKLGISASGFGGGLNVNVALTATQFAVGTTATTAAQRFIFDNISRNLYFDIDGNGAATMVQIAKIAGSTPLSATSFVITT
jgi:Ca2+-binding RTX toxin-like protein